MSYMTAVGNLAATPILRDGERGPYAYARVIVSDPIRQADGTYVNGPGVAYDLAVSGSQAVELVGTAERCGNIRVLFAGDCRAELVGEGERQHIENKVRAQHIGISLRGQAVDVDRNREPADLADYDGDTPF